VTAVLDKLVADGQLLASMRLKIFA